MSKNRELLMQAIADAKDIKEMAIANAKAALEESFTPFLKEKFSAKINEMEQEDELKEEMEESDLTSEVDDMELEEEISLDELLAELEESEKEDDLSETKSKSDDDKDEEEDEEISIEDMSNEDLTKFIENVIKDMITDGELEAGHEGMEDEEGVEGDVDIEGDEDGTEETDDIEIEDDETLDENEETEELEEEISLDELLAELEESEKEDDLSEAKSDDEELKEALSMINTLKEEISAVNLLNAKLLYTNKIFRENSLNESQKLTVLSSFDKAKTKNEAKLIYETLIVNMKNKKSQSSSSVIKESLGLASKVIGNSNVKNPIIENDAFARMRELAFGKK